MHFTTLLQTLEASYLCKMCSAWANLFFFIVLNGLEVYDLDKQLKSLMSNYTELDSHH